MKFLQQGVLVDVIEATSDIGVEDIFGFLTDIIEDGCDGIMAGASWTRIRSCSFQNVLPIPVRVQIWQDTAVRAARLFQAWG